MAGIYKIVCERCNQSYVTQMTRVIRTRFEEISGTERKVLL